MSSILQDKTITHFVARLTSNFWSPFVSSLLPFWVLYKVIEHINIFDGLLLFSGQFILISRYEIFSNNACQIRTDQGRKIQLWCSRESKNKCCLTRSRSNYIVFICYKRKTVYMRMGLRREKMRRWWLLDSEVEEIAVLCQPHLVEQGQ